MATARRRQTERDSRFGHLPIPRGDEPPDAARPVQLAGLRTHRRAPKCSYWPSLPSRSLRCAPVPLTAVVPAYRCGTVPDSHRVPSRHAPNISASLDADTKLAVPADQLHRSDYAVDVGSVGVPVHAGRRRSRWARTPSLASSWRMRSPSARSATGTECRRCAGQDYDTDAVIAVAEAVRGGHFLPHPTADGIARWPGWSRVMMATPRSTSINSVR
jgi:hypothetical protein